MEEGISLTVGCNNGKVVLDFGKRAICHVAFTYEQAHQIAESIRSAADKCLVIVGGQNER